MGAAGIVAPIAGKLTRKGKHNAKNKRFNTTLDTIPASGTPGRTGKLV
tara:strand:+ start:656 stop:799 length:144 start_codon:yes stop_codon:yes gene_type:complete